MKNIRKRLAAILLSVTAIFGGLAFANPVDAGVYTTATSCAHATAGNRICYDISLGTVSIYNNSNQIVAGPTPVTKSFATPSRGWIAYDNECNAVPIYVSTGGPGELVTWQTSFSTPGGFGLPSVVSFAWSNYGNVSTNDSADDIIAYNANANTGFECFIVL